MVLARNLFLQNRFVIGSVSGSHSPNTSIRNTQWLTASARSPPPPTSTEIPLFPNVFAVLVPLTKTESPGTKRNGQGSAPTPRFLPPDSQFLWSTVHSILSAEIRAALEAFADDMAVAS